LPRPFSEFAAQASDHAWAGTCRQLVVKLDDGTSHRASFKLTR